MSPCRVELVLSAIEPADSREGAGERASYSGRTQVSPPNPECSCTSPPAKKPAAKKPAVAVKPGKKPAPPVDDDDDDDEDDSDIDDDDDD